MASKKKAIGVAVGSAFAAGMAMSPLVSAAENPFALQNLKSGYMVAADTPAKAPEAKCGQGKCGGKKTTEAKCGGMKSAEAADPKKMGEAKCGAAKADTAAAPKAAEAKCGQGKCGAMPKK